MNARKYLSKQNVKQFLQARAKRRQITDDRLLQLHYQLTVAADEAGYDVDDIRYDYTTWRWTIRFFEDGMFKVIEGTYYECLSKLGVDKS